MSAWADLCRERGVDFTAEADKLASYLDKAIRRASKAAAGSAAFRSDEPTDLGAIRAARPRGPRRLPLGLSDAKLRERLLGAWLGRCAGCVLGIPVEGWSSEDIADLAEQQGIGVPPASYWKLMVHSHWMHYSEPKANFLKGNIDHVGPDDDLAYTVLGLLILEEYGPDFTPQDVGRAWLRYLPMACTAEHVALQNLRAGLVPPATALHDNPYCDWIGAAIRADAWGYVCAGLPELAAEFAWRDAVVSHTACGVHGEMFWAAVIASAFAVDDVEAALRVGLSEIPRRCRLRRTVLQTIRWCKSDGDWRVTLGRVRKKFAGMSGAHTLNNAALTVMGLLYGGGDFSKTIGYTVLFGIDTDCTAATAGSVLGAIIGAKGIPRRWTSCFNDRLTTYLKGREEFAISDLVDRTLAIARQVRGRYG